MWAKGPLIVLRGLASVVIAFVPVLGDSTSVESLFVLDESSCSADFRFAAAERGKEFLSVVSRELYNTFVLVRDSGLCLFVEKSLQRINPSLVQANCINTSGS